MSKSLMNTLMLAVLAWSPIQTLAGTSRGFSDQFNNYRAKYALTTYQTAKAFSSRLHIKPEQVLKRYVMEQWMTSSRKNQAIIDGIDAFRESGLNHEQALTKMSDIVGQLTETLQAIYTQERGAPVVTAKRSPVAPRGLASINRR
jgi:hypothetical protein